MKRIGELNDAEIRQVLTDWSLSLAGRKADKILRIRSLLLEKGENPDNFDFETVLANPHVASVENLHVMMEQLLSQNRELAKQLSSMQAANKNFEGQMNLVQQELHTNLSEMEQQTFSREERLQLQINGLVTEIEQLKSTSVSPIAHSTSGFIKPPTYDGESSWTVFQKQFEAAASLNSWTDNVKAIQMVVSLRGKAADLVQMFPCGKDRDYDYICGELESRFGDKNLKILHQSQLASRQQSYGETLQEFFADIERLCMLVYNEFPVEILDSMITDIFARGIRDPDVKQAVILSEKKKSKEVLAYSLAVESSRKVSRPAYKIREVVEEEVIDRVIEDKNRIRCWGCGEYGHLRNKCNKLKTSGNAKELPEGATR